MMHQISEGIRPSSGPLAAEPARAGKDPLLKALLGTFLAFARAFEALAFALDGPKASGFESLCQSVAGLHVGIVAGCQIVVLLDGFCHRLLILTHQDGIRISIIGKLVHDAGIITRIILR